MIVPPGRYKGIRRTHTRLTEALGRRQSRLENRRCSGLQRRRIEQVTYCRRGFGRRLRCWSFSGSRRRFGRRGCRFGRWSLGGRSRGLRQHRGAQGYG